MPVAITIATVLSIRRSRAARRNPFTDAAALRKKILDTVAAGTRQDAALAEVDALAGVVQAYGQQANAALEVYLRQAAAFDVGTDELESSVFAPIENQRRATLVEVVAVRERLRKLLTPAEWEAAFGG